MATSGSIDFNLTQTQICTRALNILNKSGTGSTPDTSDLELAGDLLNMMIKAWQAEGIHLWASAEGIMFFEDGVSKYPLSSTSTTHTCSPDDFVRTTIGADEANGQTTLTVVSSADMTVNDNVGIILDNGTLHWTTISVIPNSTSITILNAITDSASAGNYVFSYTTKLNRPLKIMSARRATGSGETLSESQLRRLSHDDYININNKNTNSTPTSFYYSPQLNEGNLYLWAAPDNVRDYLTFSYVRSIEDFDLGSNTADFPQEAIEALVWGLAFRLTAPFSADPKQIAAISNMANMAKASLYTFDNETTGIRICLDED